MYGFQPKSKPAAVPFGSRGVDQLRAMIPAVQAMGYPQAAPVQQPAQAPAAPDANARLRAMIPQMAAMGYPQAPAVPPQYLADGGLVGTIKSALGFKPADPERAARLAEYRAQAAREKAAQQAAAPASAPAPETKAITDYTSGGAIKRREQAAGLANGGLIRGPGTGTSDSIPDEMEPGTYIMPADSTRQLGLDDKKVPVRVSNGEYELPPEQVQAVGAAVLDVVKGATHAPAQPAARGFRPRGEQVFADGGQVDPMRPNNFGDAAAATRDASVTQVATGSPSPAAAAVTAPAATASAAATPAIGATPTPPAPAVPTQPPAILPSSTPAAPMGWAERNAQRNLEVTASSIMDSPERRAAQQQLSAAGQPKPAPSPIAPPPAAAPPAAATLAQPAVQNSSTFQSRAAFGFQPRRYADGGIVQDEERQRLANQTAMYVQGAQAAAAARPPEAQPAVVAPPTAQQAPAAASTPRPLAGQVRARWQDNLDELQNPTPYQGQVGNLFLQPSGTPAQLAAIRPGVSRGDAGRGTVNPPAVVPQNTASSQGMADPASASMAGAGRGTVNPPMANPSAPAPTNAPAPGGTTGNVTRVGNSYSGTNVSGDITVNGQAPRGGFMVADGARGFSPGAPATAAPQGVTAPTVLHSGNSWQARNDLRNALVSASSITNNGGKWDQNGKGVVSPERAAYLAMLGTDQALQQAQPAADVMAMRENAGLQREGIQQQGATTRTGMTEQGANAREAGRNALATDELGLKREAAGFTTRAAAQAEQLRSTLLDPKATPEQKRQAQQNLQALAGKTDQWKAVALQGGTDAQGNKTESILGAVNERTGEMRRMDGGQGGGAQPSANHLAALKANPKQAAQFDEVYGPGAAARALKGG